MRSMVVALVAPIGAGKETFTGLFRGALLKRCVNPSISVNVFSDILTKVCRTANILPSRENLQKMPVVLKESFPGWTLAKTMQAHLEADMAEVKIVDGVRWSEDLEMIREFPRSKLVYITAEQKTRFERVKLRNQKPGEGEMTWEQFLEKEQAKTEAHIAEIGNTADFAIENNGTLGEYSAKIETFVDYHFLPMFLHQEKP